MTANSATILCRPVRRNAADKVWRLLTEPGLHARWWVPGDIAAIVGHRFQSADAGLGFPFAWPWLG